jgi:hypothetical protein
MMRSPASQNADWMVVYVTHNIHEAEIVLGHLKSEGIQAFMHQAAGASAIGIHIGSLGEIKILVRPPDYDEALAILFPEEQNQLPDDTDRIIFEDDEPDE